MKNASSSNEPIHERQASNLSLLCDDVRKRVKDDPALLIAFAETMAQWAAEEKPAQEWRAVQIQIGNDDDGNLVVSKRLVADNPTSWGWARARVAFPSGIPLDGAIAALDTILGVLRDKREALICRIPVTALDDGELYSREPDRAQRDAEEIPI